MPKRKVFDVGYVVAAIFFVVGSIWGIYLVIWLLHDAEPKKIEMVQPKDKLVCVDNLFYMTRQYRLLDRIRVDFFLKHDWRGEPIPCNLSEEK